VKQCPGTTTVVITSTGGGWINTSIPNDDYDIRISLFVCKRDEGVNQIRPLPIQQHRRSVPCEAYGSSASQRSPTLMSQRSHFGEWRRRKPTWKLRDLDPLWGTRFSRSGAPHRSLDRTIHGFLRPSLERRRLHGCNLWSCPSVGCRHMDPPPRTARRTTEGG